MTSASVLVGVSALIALTAAALRIGVLPARAVVAVVPRARLLVPAPMAARAEG